MNKNLLLPLIIILATCIKACTPPPQVVTTEIVSVKITATPQPTSTFTPEPTNTLEPSATPTETPIPTLEGLSVSVPDPKISNPELFDSTIQDSPASQLSNAMKMAGYEIPTDLIKDNLIFEERTDVNDEPYIITRLKFDPDSSQQKESLENPILFMWDQEQGWRSGLNPGELGNKNGIFFGSMLTGWHVRNPSRMRYKDIPPKFFGMLTAPDIAWSTDIEGGKYDLRPESDKFNFKIPDYLLDYANKNKLPVQLMHVFFGVENTIPSWVKEVNSKDEFYSMTDYHITTLLSHYKGKIDSYTLINEYFGNPFSHDPKLEYWHNKVKSLGITNEEFITHIFKTASETDSRARFIFNEYGMEVPGTTTYVAQKDQKIFKLLQEALKNEAPINAVGFQMHLYARDFLGDNFQGNMESFRNQIRKYKELGIEVDITELDVRLNEGLSHLNNEEKLKLQARIYENIVRIAKQEGISHITVWGISDKDSWLEQEDSGRLNASESDPLLFDDGNNIKPALIGVLEGLSE